MYCLCFIHECRYVIGHTLLDETVDKFQLPKSSEANI